MPLSLKFSMELAKPRPAPTKWRGCSAEHVVVPAGQAFEFAHTGDLHYLATHDMCLREAELKIDSLPIIRGRDLRETITFIPKGCAISGWAQSEHRPNSFTAVYFDPALINEELGARYVERPPPPAVYARDPSLRSTLLKIQGLVKDPDADPLQAEGLCLIAALEVFGIVSSPDTGRLSERQMSQVRSFVDEHMDQPISLSDMAQAAGLSRFHFSRAFKATTGESPYRFVATLRVEAASRILRASDLPLETVAASVGFNSTVQLRRAFQDRMGMSPQAFQRQSR